MQTLSDTLSAPAPEIGAGTRTARLLAGTMVSTDLEAARAFYEGFLGLDCVRYAEDGLLIRDQVSRAEMEAGGDDFFVIDVRRVDAVENPQRMLHHWGLDVVSSAEVDRIHAVAKARKDEFGLRKLFPVSDVHGAHSFYFADRDMNWWEIEFRLDGLDNEGMIHGGDRFPELAATSAAAAPYVLAESPLVSAGALATDAVVSRAHLTHGTCEQGDLEGAQRFLKTVLGLRCVRHLEPAQIIAGAGRFGVFGIRLPRVAPQGRENRWIVAVADEAQVDAVAGRARDALGLGLRSVERLQGRFGPACVVQDADGNWWETTAMDPAALQATFARGDVSGAKT